ncbi:serine hydrolase [Planctomycetota bacterium]|nr:serine hydrolase [Planctomycetota bacterium]
MSLRFSIMPSIAVAAALTAGCVSQESTNMNQSFKQRPKIEQGELEKLLKNNKSKFETVLADPETFRVQALYSIIEDDGSIERHGYRIENEYFYPASSIKAFASVAALQHLHELNEKDDAKLKPQTPLAIFPLFADETYQYDDESNLIQGKKTIEHEIRRTLLVSSNSAFNHLFEFVGHERINKMCEEYGFDQTFYMHRLSEFRSIEANQTSPKMEFHMPNGDIYTVPERKSELIYTNDLPGIDIGDGYMNNDGSITDEPLSFKYKNRASVRDLQDIMIKIVRPDVDLGTPAFKITEEDRDILKDALSTYPLDSSSPKYVKKNIGSWIADTYFVPGLLRVDPERDNWLVHEKSGQAWAFTIENVVVTHLPTNKTFALTAVMFTNKRNIMNTDDYEYPFAFEFYADLGEAVARKVLDK